MTSADPRDILDMILDEIETDDLTHNELDQLIHVLSPAFLRKEFAKRAAIAERVNAYEGKPRIVR